MSIADTGPSAQGGVVPPIDGLSLLPYLSGKATASPRTELPLSCLSPTTIFPGDSRDEGLAQFWAGGALIVGSIKIVYG